MVRVALHLDRHAVFHGGQQGTGVGAVVGAGAQDGGGHGRILHVFAKSRHCERSEANFPSLRAQRSNLSRRQLAMTDQVDCFPKPNIEGEI